VRSLKQLLEKTYRKVALKLVRGGLSGPVPRNEQENAAKPGEAVSEHGGVGLGDEAPQQPPPETSTSGQLQAQHHTVCVVCVMLLSMLALCSSGHPMSR